MRKTITNYPLNIKPYFFMFTLNNLLQHHLNTETLHTPFTDAPTHTNIIRQTIYAMHPAATNTYRQRYNVNKKHRLYCIKKHIILIFIRIHSTEDHTKLPLMCYIPLLVWLSAPNPAEHPLVIYFPAFSHIRAYYEYFV